MKYYQERPKFVAGDTIIQDETGIVRIIVSAEFVNLEDDEEADKTEVYEWKYPFSDEVFWSGNDSDPELRWGWQLKPA